MSNDEALRCSPSLWCQRICISILFLYRVAFPYVRVCLSLTEMMHLDLLIAQSSCSVEYFCCLVSRGQSVTTHYPRMFPESGCPVYPPTATLASELAPGLFLSHHLYSQFLFTVRTLCGSVLLFCSVGVVAPTPHPGRYCKVRGDDDVIDNGEERVYRWLKGKRSGSPVPQYPSLV